MTASLVNRMPQQLRSALVAIESHGFDAAADDRLALQTLLDNQKHIDPRQASLRALLGIEINRLVMTRDLSDARNLARVIREHMGQLTELMRIEDERVQTALELVRSSLQADLRVIGGAEALIGERGNGCSRSADGSEGDAA